MSWSFLLCFLNVNHLKRHKVTQMSNLANMRKCGYLSLQLCYSISLTEYAELEEKAWLSCFFYLQNTSPFGEQKWFFFCAHRQVERTLRWRLNPSVYSPGWISGKACASNILWPNLIQVRTGKDVCMGWVRPAGKQGQKSASGKGTRVLQW
jgi:hypothetical protein